MKSKNFSQLIRLSDFAQIRHIIYLRNETSQTNFIHDKQVSLREIGANYMIMEGPSECCQHGHQVTLTLVPNSLIKSVKIPNIHMNEEAIKLVARVEQYSLLSDKKRATWTIRFTQYNIKEWNDIIETYQNQQDKINDLLSE
jgi:aspartate/glutamate racemase